MAPESTNPHNNSNSSDNEKQKNLDHEIRELINSLTKRITSMQRSNKPGSSNTLDHENEEENGVSIITLTGSNVGATMRGDTGEKLEGLEQDEFCTYVNSNFQAVNNSIMVDGSYETNDPGVHVDITDYLERDNNINVGNSKRGNRKGRKNNKNNDESKSEHQIDRAEHSA